MKNLKLQLVVIFKKSQFSYHYYKILINHQRTNDNDHQKSGYLVFYEDIKFKRT